MARRYHQTREDRRHEAAGARRGHHGRRRGHQTAEDRRHESEGMRGHHRSRSHGSHHGPYHQTERDRADESRAMRHRQHRGSESSHGSHRYRQTREDRRHESEGMRGRYGDYHDPHVSRRGLDREYMGMIHEDHYETANLPQEVKMEHYPRGEYLEEDINDTISRVDDDMDNSIHMLRVYESKTMY